MKNAIRIILLALSVMMLSSCGGESNPGNSSDEGDSTSKTFTVSLENVDVRRVSNGEIVKVDTTDITSGELSLNQ
ncbi:hypothetical protein ACFL6N_01760 [Thermodesulfobacteriota bacterium]